MSTLRYLQSSPSTVEIRTAVHSGVTHLVVPAVMLVGDIVLRGINSAGPEFVPADLLAEFPSAWAGRPVVYDHPYQGQRAANEPTTLENYQFGKVFYPSFTDNRLRAELWLNPAQADKLGEGAQTVIQKVNKRELVEGSTGCFIKLREQAGVHNGKRYEFVWTRMAADHYAFGLGGSKGACSVADGCGGPRVNTAADAGKHSDKHAHHHYRLIPIVNGNYTFNIADLRKEKGVR